VPRRNIDEEKRKNGTDLRIDLLALLRGGVEWNEVGGRTHCGRPKGESGD
jgi:hypothetical protein